MKMAFLERSLDSPKSRFRAALVLAVIADAAQMIAFPLFAEGALSPADDIFDFLMALVLTGLLGWHWEFTPSMVAKLIPGVDLVPFWTIAVANVYRKWKRSDITVEAVDHVDAVPPDRKLLKH
ncbi:MAG TPA: hypothetical protein VFB23_05130 [Candidatus Acidoferrales bacterium]|nr:hypothetical protein [Candidatus Acidoferrales bacterium]